MERKVREKQKGKEKRVQAEKGIRMIQTYVSNAVRLDIGPQSVRTQTLSRTTATYAVIVATRQLIAPRNIAMEEKVREVGNQ